MAYSEENLDETCDVHDAERLSVTSVDEVGSQHVTKSSSVRPLSGGPYQGPHDWRKRLRPITNLDRLGNCAGDQKVKSPNGTRQKDGADVPTVSYDRSVIL